MTSCFYFPRSGRDDSAVSRQKKDAEANWKSQGQMLTAVEYGLVLYHAVLPPPGQMLTAVEYGLVLYHAVLPAPFKHISKNIDRLEQETAVAAAAYSAQLFGYKLKIS
ncbi:hypothetical protein QQ045_011812 [Rhodiola kirilowii]